MKRKLFIGTAAVLAAAFTVSGISTKGSVTDLTELKASAEVICTASPGECETPNHVYSGKIKDCGCGTIE